MDWGQRTDGRELVREHRRLGRTISGRVFAHVILGAEGTYDRCEHLPQKRTGLKNSALVDRILKTIEW